MTLADLKGHFGDEYPAAVIVNGIRLPLVRESRFSRFYSSDEHKMGCQVSRFMDGSVSLSAWELQREWPAWTGAMQLDFCEASRWLHEQSDYPDMLRFVMKHGDHNHWSSIALNVASHMPRNEAFENLVRALRCTKLGRTSNISQAIAHTKHDAAEATLRNHVTALWAQPLLWEKDDFINWLAFDLTTCVAHLIDLGANPDDFAEQVRQLSNHVCAGNRRSCSDFLLKHYSWLQTSNR